MPLCGTVCLSWTNQNETALVVSSVLCFFPKIFETNARDLEKRACDPTICIHGNKHHGNIEFKHFIFCWRCFFPGFEHF